MNDQITQIEDAVRSRLVCPTTVTLGDLRTVIAKPKREVYSFHVDARGYYGAFTRTYWLADFGDEDPPLVEEYEDPGMRDLALRPRSSALSRSVAWLRLFAPPRRSSKIPEAC